VVKIYRVLAVELHIFLISALERDECLAANPCRSVPREITPVFILQKDGWLPELVSTSPFQP
jgi:hypothetical protein